MKEPSLNIRLLATLLAALMLLGSGCAGQENGAAPAITAEDLDGEPQRGLEEIELRMGDVSLRAEVADTHESRQHGLMYRLELADDQGMLFVYPRAWRLSFWMQNTYIPLDIAFIDRSGFIIDIQSMEPLTTHSHRAPAPIPYALEVNRGWFEANDIQIGDHVQGLPSPATAE